MRATSLLHEHLAYLKLGDIAEQCEPLAADAAAKGWTHLDYLQRLLEGECRARQGRAIERRVLPRGEDDGPVPLGLAKEDQRAAGENLFRLTFVEKKTNVVVMGGVGLGKSHSATALGYDACRRGHGVLFTTAVDALNNLVAAQAAQRLKAELKRYLAPAVLVLDELGYLPLDKTGADLLFQIIRHAIERFENNALRIIKKGYMSGRAEESDTPRNQISTQPRICQSINSPR